MNAGTQDQQPPPEQVDLAVEVFRLLADPTRVRLLWAMRGHECSVNELATAVNKSPSGVSQHLAKLRMGRLVSTRRDGQHVFYRIESPHVAQLVEDAIYQADHASPGLPAHHRNDAVTELAPAVPDEAGQRSRRGRAGK
jgi:DNA-binding transcriptional ArsR family regulator